MDKLELRKLYKSKRRALNAEKIKDWSNQINNKIAQSKFLEYQNFHLFKSISKLVEVDTEPIFNTLLNQEKSISVPKIENNILNHCLISKNEKYTINTLGIAEPIDCKFTLESKFDVVFIPMLICDTKGNRVGYGKGFYDKFLVNCRPETIKVGLNFFDPIEKEISTNKYDIPLDYCVTPFRIVSFSEISEK